MWKAQAADHCRVLLIKYQDFRSADGVTSQHDQKMMLKAMNTPTRTPITITAICHSGRGAFPPPPPPPSGTGVALGVGDGTAMPCVVSACGLPGAAGLPGGEEAWRRT